MAGAEVASAWAATHSMICLVAVRVVVSSPSHVLSPPRYRWKSATDVGAPCSRTTSPSTASRAVRSDTSTAQCRISGAAAPSTDDLPGTETRWPAAAARAAKARPAPFVPPTTSVCFRGVMNEARGSDGIFHGHDRNDVVQVLPDCDVPHRRATEYVVQRTEDSRAAAVRKTVGDGFEREPVSDEPVVEHRISRSRQGHPQTLLIEVTQVKRRQESRELRTRQSSIQAGNIVNFDDDQTARLQDPTTRPQRVERVHDMVEDVLQRDHVEIPCVALIVLERPVVNVASVLRDGLLSVPGHHFDAVTLPPLHDIEKES